MAQKVRGALADGAKLTFVSCSTGVDAGIAEFAAEYLGKDAYAPLIDVSLRDYSVSLSADGNLEIEPHYAADRGSYAMTRKIIPDGKIGQDSVDIPNQQAA